MAKLTSFHSSRTGVRNRTGGLKTLPKVICFKLIYIVDMGIVQMYEGKKLYVSLWPVTRPVLQDTVGFIAYAYFASLA